MQSRDPPAGGERLCVSLDRERQREANRAPSHTDEQTVKRIRRRAIRQLEEQGYKVILEPQPKAA